MNYSVASPAPRSALSPPAVARWFLNDLAQVSGFAVEHGDRGISPYVMNRPILTKPDPWFFAGLVALEGAKIADLFTKQEAGAILREITEQVDLVVGRRGRKIAKIVFTLMGRLGYGAIIMRKKVPDDEIGRVIRILLGGTKDWKHLIPDVKAHRQICKALAAGEPSWWNEYRETLEANEKSKQKPN